MRSFLIRVAALGASVALVSPSFAVPVQVPVVLNSAGTPIEATAVINVDTTGAYSAAGGGGSSYGGTNVSSACPPDGATTCTPDQRLQAINANTANIATAVASTAPQSVKIDQTTPGTTNLVATGLGVAEDSANADGETGVVAFAVRQATPANTSGTDGDHEALRIFNGRLWTDFGLATGPVTPGTVASLSLLDGAQYNSTPPTLTTGQQAAMQEDARGNLKVSVNDGANQAVVSTAGADAVSNTLNGLGVYSRPSIFNGTTYDRWRGTSTGGAYVQGGGASGSAAVGNPDRIGATTTAGNTINVCAGTDGALCTPKGGTADRVVTKTSLAANTNTTICPTATAPVATEIFFSVSGVGISDSGGTLTTATPGTTANTTPDWATTAANGYYLFPVPPTNAITAYGAAGLITCIQYIRQ